MSATVIQLGLPQNLRTQAAKIYFEAFRQKLQPIIGEPEFIIRLLTKYFNEKNALVALYKGQLAGISGLYHNDRSFVNIPYKAVCGEFGWLRGTFKYGLLGLLSRHSVEGELLMDGIAVDSSMRGNGIGTQLLEAVFNFAHVQQYKTIRLDVIDTNPLAKRLYERMGFVATKIQYTPYLRHFMGFSSVTTMIKSVQ